MSEGGGAIRNEMAQLMPLPLTVSCFSKSQIGFTFLLSVHRSSSGKGPLNGCLLFVYYYYPRESEGLCFYRRWFVCLSVCLSVGLFVCLFVTTITK